MASVEVCHAGRGFELHMIQTERLHPVQHRGGDRAVLAFSFATAHLPGLGGSLARDLVFPWHSEFGRWLLGVQGVFVYSWSFRVDFVRRLLLAGLFFLPSAGSPMYPCPWPLQPFVFRPQQDVALWQKKSKALRRHGKDFAISCNVDLEGHLRACSEYYEERGGTWMNEQFIDVILRIAEDSGSVKVWCFELWERATGRLAAATFGYSVGAYFQDFSMCGFIRDKRSAGSILTKVVGALLSACGVLLWYWGYKVGYMGDYSSYGGGEISRAEYFDAFQRAMAKDLRKDPGDAIRASEALLPHKS